MFAQATAVAVVVCMFDISPLFHFQWQVYHAHSKTDDDQKIALFQTYEISWEADQIVF